MRGGTQLKPLLKMVETKEAMNQQNAQPWSLPPLTSNPPGGLYNYVDVVDGMRLP